MAPEITVVVDVAGLTPDISALFVTNTLNNGTPQSGPEITGRMDEFAIALPITTSGHLTINIVGRSAEHCVVASGQVAVDIQNPPTRYQVSVTLIATSDAVKSCTLTLNVLGKGTITSTPPGLQCVGAGKLSTPTTCTYDFPVGTMITLSTTADPKIYGTTYSGLCSGTADCTLTFNAPGTVTAGIADRVCSNNSWCWYNPLPQGNPLRAIWGVAANDIWAVGDAGTLLHYNGATWSSPVPTGTATTQDLYAVYGQSATDIWAVGNAGALVHWDGTTWTNSAQSGLATAQPLRGVWGSGKEYWAVGVSGTILHYDGTSWSAAAGSGQTTTATLNAIWGSSSNDVWSVGSGTVILHYNGTAWAADPKSGTFAIIFGNYNLAAVGGSGPGNVWAVGSYATFIGMPKSGNLVLHYDGTTWTSGSTAGTNNLTAINALWNASSTSLWTAGFASSLFGGGSGHYDGAAWTTQNAMTAGNTVLGLWGSSDSDLWAVGTPGFLVHFDGQAWSTPPLVTPPSLFSSLYGAWANSPTDVWAVGTMGLIRHFDGTTWTNSLQSGVSTTQPLYHVWGTSSSNVMAVGGNGTLLQYANNIWSTPIAYAATPKIDPLFGVWGSQPSSVWAVGGNGALALYNSTNPSLSGYTPPVAITSTLRAVWGLSSSHIFAVGYSGTIVKYTGSWNAFASPTTNDLYGIWGTVANNTAWAVGSAGTILRYNGTAWTVEPASGSLTTNILYGVWAAPTNLVWAAGSSGTVAHYDGTTWSLSNSGTHNTLQAIWGVGIADIWAVGDYNTTLRYMP